MKSYQEMIKTLEEVEEFIKKYRRLLRPYDLYIYINTYPEKYHIELKDSIIEAIIAKQEETTILINREHINNKKIPEEYRGKREITIKTEEELQKLLKKLLTKKPA